MLDLRIAELGPTSGSAADGIVRGSVAQSLLTAALSSARLAPTIYVIRKDVAATTFTFTDETTPAGDDNADDFLPWGTTPQMSAGDELYVACDDPIAEFYVRISTPGVWAGAGLEIAYSNNGQTPNALVAGLVDGSNGFRAAAGIYRITFTVPADLVAFSPVPGAIASRRWLVLRPVGLTGVTTAPRLTRLWIVHTDSAVTYSDLTTAYNTALTDATFTGAPASVFYPLGTERVWTFPFLAYGMDHAIHRRLAATPTVAAEYLATDSTWKALAGYVSASPFFSVGPTTLGDPIQYLNERWTIPSDWGSQALTLPVAPLGGGTATNQTFSGYHMRHRLTALASLALLAPSLTRSRVRAFGAANATGLRSHTARTIAGVTIGEIGVPSTQAVVAQLVNINTGRGTSFTIPANSLGPVHVDLNPTLALAAGESLLIGHVSGGTVRDLELHVQFS